MPIRPCQKARYPADWKHISLAVREDADWQCEFCRIATHGEAHPVTGSKVVLTVAHLDHQPEHCDRANLAAMCQRCHLTYDAVHHAKNADATRRRKKFQMHDLFAEVW